jgi:hypothetical protein
VGGKTIVLDTCTPADASDDVTTTTAADGSYSFTGLTPGVTYCVSDPGEPGWLCTDPGAGCEHTLTPGSGDTASGRDFGAYRAASVSGTTFEDENADGDRDAGEPGIGGRTVYADVDGSGDVSTGDVTTTSAADGSWALTLDPGGYTIREELPDPTWHHSLPAGGTIAVTLVAGDDSTGNDFGSWQEATISGTRYDDRDGDGERDPGEPGVGGRTITLDPCTPNDPSDDVEATTAADGGYSFTGVTPGVTYCVTDEGEPGWTCTDPGAGCEHAITPSSGETASGRDFGAYRDPVLEVRQVVAPATDEGAFDLSVDGAIEKRGARHGHATGRKTKAPGSHAVAQAAAAPTNGSDYDTTLECRDGAGTGSVVPSAGGSVTLSSGDDVVCVFTSSRKPAPPVDPPVEPEPPVEPQPPVEEPEVDPACLKRPVVTWVKGAGVRRVVFYLDGKRRQTVTRPDSRGRFSMRTLRSTLSPGRHEVRARVYFKNAKRAPRTLRFAIEPCLKLEAPKRIETTAKPGELDTCAGSSFRAYVRGDTIRRVIFYMDGRRVKSTRVADWKGRYWVAVKPSALSAGSHELSARTYFISGAKQRSTTLKLRFRRCAR